MTNCCTSCNACMVILHLPSLFRLEYSYYIASFYWMKRDSHSRFVKNATDKSYFLYDLIFLTSSFSGTTEKIFETKEGVWDVYVDNQNIRAKGYLNIMTHTNHADRERFEMLDIYRYGTITMQSCSQDFPMGVHAQIQKAAILFVPTRMLNQEPNKKVYLGFFNGGGVLTPVSPPLYLMALT